MNKMFQRIAGIFLVAAGLCLYTLDSDQQFIYLAPTPGRAAAVTLQSGETYEQTFTTHKGNISRVGVYVWPLEKNIPDMPITISLFQGTSRIHEQAVSVVFAAADAATSLSLPQPVITQPGDTIRVRVSVPRELSGKISLQTRTQDDTFSQDARFSISGTRQPNPLAYEAYYSHKPTLPLYVGGLLVVFGLGLVGGIGLQHATGRLAYAGAVTLVATIPLFFNGSYSLVLIAVQVLLMFGSMQFLSKRKIPLPASLLAAHTLAFTTWWPSALVLGRKLFTSPSQAGLGSIRDTFLDPHQFALPHAGAYVGLAAAVLAAVGLSYWKHGDRTLIRLQAAAVLLLSIGITSLPLLGAAAVAILAAAGITFLSRFLGQNDPVVRVLQLVIIYLALLDSLVVYARLLGGSS